MRVALIVDDSDLVRTVVSDLLSDQGYLTIDARNGEEALQQVETGNPDLILIDWMLDDFDTKGLIQRIRSVSGFETTPIVYATTVNDANDIGAALAAGATTAVLKPYDALSFRELMTDLGQPVVA
ncbi:MAG: response regulator [Pseudomonadota bacterium]